MLSGNSGWLICLSFLMWKLYNLRSRTNEWTNEQTNKRTNEWTKEQTNKWMIEQMKRRKEWTNERTHERTSEGLVYFKLFPSSPSIQFIWCILANCLIKLVNVTLLLKMEIALKVYFELQTVCGIAIGVLQRANNVFLIQKETIKVWIGLILVCAIINLWFW
jgi:hypothetical protein